MADLTRSDIIKLIAVKPKEVVLNLTGVDLQGVDLSNLDLSGADFSNANLSHVNLLKTNLRGACFAFATLKMLT